MAIAMTFDDGPNNTTTPRLIDLLAELDVQVTFFVLGTMVQRNAAVLRRIADATQRHEVCNHSWSHESFKRMTDAQIRTGIEDTNKIIADTIGAAKATKISPATLRGDTAPPTAVHHAGTWLQTHRLGCRSAGLETGHDPQTNHPTHHHAHQRRPSNSGARHTPTHGDGDARYAPHPEAEVFAVQCQQIGQLHHERSSLGGGIHLGRGRWLNPVCDCVEGV